MKKKLILCFIIILILFSALGGYLIIDNIFNDYPEEVTIDKYDDGGFEIVGTFTIDSKNEIKKITRFVNKLKPLEDEEMVNLAIIRQIEIHYSDSITVGIQLGEKDYCFYTNENENISSLSHMPTGLYEWVERKVLDEWNEIDIVNNELNKVVRVDGFYDLPLNERKKKVEIVLNKYKKAGLIKNITYSDEAYSFQYKNGVLGGIRIKKFDPYMN